MRIQKLLSTSYVRQVLVFLSFFMVAQSLIIIAMSYSYQHSINQQHAELADSILNTLNETVNRSVDQAEADLQSLMAMNIDARILSGHRENARVTVASNLSNTLNMFVSTAKATDAYIIYNDVNDIFILSRSDRIKYSEMDSLRSYAEALATSQTRSNAGWHTISLNGQTYLLHFYYYYNCYFIAAFHLETFFTMLSYDKLFDEDSCVLLTDPDWNPLAQAGSCALDSSGSPPKSGDGYYVGTKSLGYGMLQASYISKREMTVMTDVMPIFIVGVCVSCLFLLVAFLRFLQREILIPMDELSKTVLIIKHGDYTRRAQLDCRSPELQELATSINAMISTIIDQRILSYENAIRQKNMELKYLQMQLRPHHFLNTLSTIYSMTYLGDNDRIRKFVELYSRDARYLFSVSFRAVPLREEIRHIQDYIDCQSILYPDCVFSFLDIRPEAETWQVPQMMLHALVENIYKHAVSLDTFTSFFISASLQDVDGEQMLQIIVEDDGIGFPEDVIQKINHADGTVDDGSHVGLMNIRHTLYLMYGRSDLMTLQNKKNGGGWIRVFIPRTGRLEHALNQEEGYGHNERADR